MPRCLRRRLVLAAAVFTAAGGAVLACGDSSSEDSGSAVDASLPKGSNDAGAGDGSLDAATAGTSFRLAHLSADLGRIDVCYRTSPSEAFTGPLILGVPSIPDAGDDLVPADAAIDGSAADAGDASSDADAGPPVEPPGVSFPGVTRYFDIPTSGTIEVAIVRAIDGNCSAPRARRSVTLDPGKRSTIALFGLAQADAGTPEELGLVAFVDDPSPAAGSTRTRFIHGAFGGAKSRSVTTLAIEATDQATVVPLAAAVEPGQVATASAVPPVVDALGYHDGQPLASGSIHVAEVGDAGADASPVSWLSAPRALDLREGATHTGFVVSEPGGDLRVLLCDDGASDVDGGCALLQP